MLTSTSGTMTASSTSLTLPADYIEDKYFTLTGTAQARLVRKPIQELIQSFTYDGSGNRVQTTPQLFSNDQSNFLFDSMADQPYPYLLYYYQQPAALSTSNTTNVLTSRYPRMFRAACMAGASEFMKDMGVGNYDRTYWDSIAENEIMEAQRETERAEHTIEAGFIQI